MKCDNLKNSFYFAVILAVILSFSAIAVAQQGENINLVYKFKKGDNLQYKTERHDSSTSSFGGQAQSIKSTWWTLNTLTILDMPENTYEISVKSDSSWADEETQSRMNGMISGESGNVTIRRSSGGGSGGMSMRMGGEGHSGETNIQMTRFGKSATKDPIMTPFILPLPEKSIAVNEEWTFEKSVEHKGRRKGNTTTKGQCLLYEVRKDDNKNLAVIIVNSNTQSNVSFSGERDGVAFSVETQSSTTAFHLVFFNIDRGIIEEINSEETRESAFEMMGNSNTSSSSTKSTIKLISG